MEAPVTFEQFCKKYRDEESCVDVLAALRWGNGFHCSYCGHNGATVMTTRRLPLYQCQACRRQTSLIKGTIMEGSRTSLHKWFQALFLLADPDSSTNAVQLTQILSVTYKTAWLIFHKIRHAISCADAKQLLTGLVDITFSNYNHTNYWKESSQPQLNQVPFIAGATTNFFGEVTYFKLKQVHLPSRLTSREPHNVDYDRFIIEHVSSQVRNPNVYTYENDFRASETLRLFCQMVTDSINDRYFGVSPKHLQAYLDELCFRTINSVRPNRGVVRLFKMLATTATITYKQLISPARTPELLKYAA
ncbi:transposase [Paenibacillus swuensis]|uniref:transposase n=1 Tax=Paenibacillus swuensis TaxID=1178515 RepID=UPI000837DDC5|nr:transposase [Paenibacillus swuensis]